MEPRGKPWWQLTNTPTMALFLGWFWLVIGVAQTTLAAFDDDGGGARRAVRLALAVLTVLLGLGYLASAFAHRRRTRDEQR